MVVTDWQTEVSAAYQRVKPYVVRTPVVTLSGLDLPFSVEAKLEHLQHAGSFKARGAFNSLSSMQVPEAGLVAASGGNHGAAVAFAAKTLGHRAKIFVPEFAGQAKIGAIERAGADLTVLPGEYANCLDAALEYEAETGAGQVHAYDAVGTIAGQGTLALEWLEQGMKADTLLIAVGGGGLIAGAIAALGTSVRIIAVETETTTALHSALAAGKPTEVEVSGIAANALGARSVGDLPFGLARNINLRSILVTDAAVERAQHDLWQAHRLLVEPAAATGLAALQSGAYVPEADERVGILLCGGNLTQDPFS